MDKQGKVKRGALNKDDCPSKDFTPGAPNGTCWGDGHFKCKECIHYREDFKRLGQHFIDFAHSPEMQPVYITTLENYEP